MLCEKILNLFVGQELILSQAKNHKSLISCYEATFDSQTLLCNRFSASVAVLLGEGLVVLLLIKGTYFFETLVLCQRPNIAKVFFSFIWALVVVIVLVLL